MSDLVIIGRRVVASGVIAPASIHVRDGRIAGIAGYDDVPRDCEMVDAGNSVVMAGLVDSHVHVNEPGRTEWEGYVSATRAAAAGGVTTIVDMPLNSIPPTTTSDGFKIKLDSARDQCLVDVAFWGGVIPGNTSQLAAMLQAGVRGFKCFLIHSGVDEFPNVTEADLRIALRELTAHDSVLLVHAELPEPIESAAAEAARNNPKLFNTFLQSRPRQSENQAIELMIGLAGETGARIHIVHHSSSDALPLLERAKADGVRVTVETCPHYLTFAAEDIPEGATEFKCCPPVRERENREKLWDALASGIIDMVVSDHSPCSPHLKLREAGDFVKAWGGIASLQLGLPVMWTNMKERGFTLNKLTEWMSFRPAQLAGLDDRKGRISPNLDADFVIWDPDRSFTVQPDIIEHRHKITPYNGRTLTGVVEAVYVRGQRVFDAGTFASAKTGNLITW